MAHKCIISDPKMWCNAYVSTLGDWLSVIQVLVATSDFPLSRLNVQEYIAAPAVRRLCEGHTRE